MEPKIITTEAFYQNLGKLFYAIAFADKRVRDEEFSKLQLCVLEYWLDYDDLLDTFGSDASFLIEIVFEGVEAFEEPADSMYDAFVTYKREQPHLFTEKANKLILETASAIARSFSGLNKSELVMLGKLKLELERS
ncbi:hypothetical protein EAX61_01685 [Dokdonia sinensis]|uniref:TerB family tellurite resistance protein n=1 Tax=Dokdonia sinensis TaxID=2479847 RepID=A0A3M0GQY6_9FLAO|nr:hypothetical protein [Dokdonia sinensis]RMB64113.1 hypothetical protein EAX61_01685 [Dokdonia sinensis]